MSLSAPARVAAVALAAAAVVAAPVVAASPPMLEHRTFTAHDGTRIPYVLVSPQGDGPAPALLALPPGAQDEAMVDWAVERYWRYGPAAGWIVACPAAPPGGWDAPLGKRYALDLMREIADGARIEGGRFHLAGISNGGAAAFHLATDLPDRFQSLTVLPGMPQGVAPYRRLERLGDMPVTMFVGEHDTGWLSGARRTAERLRRTVTPVSLVVVPGEGHVLESLMGGAVFERLDRLRPGAVPLPVPAGDDTR